MSATLPPQNLVVGSRPSVDRGGLVPARLLLGLPFRVSRLLGHRRPDGTRPATTKEPTRLFMAFLRFVPGRDAVTPASCFKTAARTKLTESDERNTS
jgi:hypothetical protein